MVGVVHYTDTDGRDLIADWLNGLRDRRAMARIAARIERLELGLVGDCRSVRGGEANFGLTMALDTGSILPGQERA